MSFVAEGFRIIAASPEEAFDRLADHGSWRAWMPPTFAPVGAELGRLVVGAEPRVRIGGGPLPAKLRVSAVDRPREIAWTGGLPGVLFAEHRFLFEPEGEGKTRVRSVETWRGALAPFVRPIVKRLAEKIAGQQLDGLAKSFVR